MMRPPVLDPTHDPIAAGDAGSDATAAFSPPPRARLLVVDDQPVNIHALFTVFAEDHDVFAATSGEQALAFCRQTPPDLILLDVVMQGMDGLEVCRQIKSDPELRGIPVVFVTGQNNPDEEAACWDAGAVDFITKPVNPRTVRNRVRAHLTLKHQADLLRRLATADGLTGLPNRRQFDERMVVEWQRARRSGARMALLMIDIDHFKAFNDSVGHLAGDDCLRAVAVAIDSAMRRPGDLAARLGGEEFGCILPDTDAAGAVSVADRAQQAITRLRIAHPASAHGAVSASIGVAVATPADGGQPADLLKAADAQLYAAKRDGRARIAVADD